MFQFDGIDFATHQQQWQCQESHQRADHDCLLRNEGYPRLTDQVVVCVWEVAERPETVCGENFFLTHLFLKITTGEGGYERTFKGTFTFTTRPPHEPFKFIQILCAVNFPPGQTPSST
jgi:hypothetical protein